VLVLRGEAGVGKTALLQYVLENAPGFRIARAAGVGAQPGIPDESFLVLPETRSTTTDLDGKGVTSRGGDTSAMCGD
jgi:hypothetical protein